MFQSVNSNSMSLAINSELKLFLSMKTGCVWMVQTHKFKIGNKNFSFFQFLNKSFFWGKKSLQSTQRLKCKNYFIKLPKYFNLIENTSRVSYGWFDGKSNLRLKFFLSCLTNSQIDWHIFTLFCIAQNKIVSKAFWKNLFLLYLD